MVIGDIDELRKRLQPLFRNKLETLAHDVGGLMAAQICTSDGFAIAATHRNQESHQRLAAMVSSLHALGSAMAEETELGEHLDIVIEGSHGKCLVMAIPETRGSLLLAAVVAPSVLFGLLHHACARACDSLAEALQKDAAAA